MKKISMLFGAALVAAVLGFACGGKTPASDQTMPSNTGGEDTMGDATGGDMYGGGMYGGGMYGTDMVD